jgi:peptide/nickel transport system substrate-binding protein
MERSVTRRSFLRFGAGGLMGAVGVLVSACGGSAPALTTTQAPGSATTPAPAAAGAATTAPAATTAAPAASASTPAPAAGAQTTPAASAQPQIGKSLVGKLEGPEVVTDPSQFPKEFHESPTLTDLVNAGKLPALKDRLPAQPIVIKPVHEVGKYGGMWRRYFTGPGDYWNGLRAASGPDRLLFWDYTGNKVVPNIAMGYDIGDGGKTMTVHLRRGLKWSDGQPFTADDIIFWYEDLYLNKDITPTPFLEMTINGKPGKIEKVDDFTVNFVFPDPYYLLPAVVAAAGALGGGDTYAGENNNAGPFAPAHYLKQFHPKYVGQAKVDQLAKAAQYNGWVTFFTYKNTWSLNADLPTLSPWKMATPANTANWTFERNPYSAWVDTAGNQLPYIDKVQFQLAESLEVLNLHAIAGDIDEQGREIDINKIPVILQNEQKGGYKLYLDPAAHGTDCGIWFNLSYEADPIISKLFLTADFRRALSLGIDRDQLNQAFWLGLGTPGSVIPDPKNVYYPGDEYRNLWSTYDLAKANQMLDKLGLDKKGSDGFRLRGDGKPLKLEIDAETAQFIDFPHISQMIAEQWKKIGVQLIVNTLERSVAEARHTANQHQLFAWQNDGSDHLFTFPGNVFPNFSTSAAGPLFGKWFASNGAQGKEPPPEMKDLMAKFRKAFGVPEEQQITLGKEIWKIMVDQQFMIGTVGLSPAILGVRVTKTNMGNVPTRQVNTPDVMTPAISRTMTWYWKEPAPGSGMP